MKSSGAMIVLGCLLAAATGVLAQSPTAPFVEPPFASQCILHHFDEHVAPPIDGCTDDPLCVEYEKRDITVTNGGAVAFLAAEPARFAIAIPKCRYWQQDHWRIQLAPLGPGESSLVQWDGSYWFDKGNGTGGARLRNFAIGGVPADPAPVADLVELVDPAMADVIRTYGESPQGGGGSTFALGYGEPACAREPGSTCETDPAVAATAAAADQACGCETAERHRDYTDCVAEFAAAEVEAGRLPAECESRIVECADDSTCGRRAGSVVCFTSDSRGEERCKIRRDESRCRAPSGGSASIGSGRSCCDPPVMEGCP